MVDDDYEILPHAELDYLRHEVERLKKNPFGDTSTGETLLDAMNNLSNNINKLTSILETASDEVIKDYEENKLSDRMDRVTEQNEKLAEGMMAVAKLVKEVLNQEKKASAIRGGYTEFSTFGKGIGSSNSGKEQKASADKNNPFEEKQELERVELDNNLPRQSFRSMDPQEEQAKAPAQNQETPDYPVMGEENNQQKPPGPLPSFKDLPPPPKNLPPLDDTPKP